MDGGRRQYRQMACASHSGLEELGLLVLVRSDLDARLKLRPVISGGCLAADVRRGEQGRGRDVFRGDGRQSSQIFAQVRQERLHVWQHGRLVLNHHGWDGKDEGGERLICSFPAVSRAHREYGAALCTSRPDVAFWSLPHTVSWSESLSLFPRQRLGSGWRRRVLFPWCTLFLNFIGRTRYFSAGLWPIAPSLESLQTALGRVATEIFKLSRRTCIGCLSDSP